MSKNITEWIEQIHSWANSKGWWSRPTDTIAAKLLLIHSEVSEAAEDLRTARLCPKGAPDADYDDLRVVNYEDGKPVGFASELADTVIRIFDMAGQIGLDLEAIID